MIEGGQVGLFIFDMAYDYVQAHVGGTMLGRIINCVSTDVEHTEGKLTTGACFIYYVEKRGVLRTCAVWL